MTASKSNTDVRNALAIGRHRVHADFAGVFGIDHSGKDVEVMAWTGRRADRDEAVRLARRVLRRPRISPGIGGRGRGVPLLDGGALVGVLVVGWTVRARAIVTDRRLVIALANELALIVAHARLLGLERKQRSQSEALAEVGRELAAELDVDRLLSLIVRHASRLLGANGAIYLFDSDNYLVPRAWSENQEFLHMRLAVGQGMAGWCAEVGDGVVLHDYSKWERAVDAFVAIGIRRAMAHPLRSEGRVLGVVVMNRRGDDTPLFTVDDQTLLANFATQAAIALKNARLYTDAWTQRTRLRDIFDATSDGIIFVTPTGHIEAANGRAEGLLGVGPLVGRTLEEALSKVATDRQGAVLLRAAREQADDDAEGDVILAPRILHWVARTTHDANSALVGLTLTLQDVTKEREVSQMKSDFVSFVTHQLRTPLSAIKWMLELAGEGASPTEAISCVIDAREAAERLIRLVNEILDVARLEGGRLTIAPQLTDLGALTTAVLRDLEPLIQEKCHNVALCVASELPPVVVDPQLLRQVVLNLASNAVKYTPPHGRITVNVRLETDRLVWEIEDTGIGIPEANRSRLFEKFFRADNVADVEGTGLGLYLVRLILEQSDGAIACESAEGRGTVFRFTLPVRRPPRHTDTSGSNGEWSTN